jgi:VWFA-related protein
MRGYALAFACVLTVATQAQEAPSRQTFRTGIDLVQVDVSVLDRQRRPVRGLTAEDFTLFEDGRPVPLVAFASVGLPAAPPAPPGAAAWLRDTAPDATANDLPREGRMVVIMFDYALQRDHAPAARKIALAAIDALGPTDLAAVLSVASGTAQGFTRDLARLRAATSGPLGGLVDAEAALTAIGHATSGNERGECLEGICTLDAITRVADSLRDVPRRKTLFLIAGRMAVERPSESAEYRRAREAMLRALDLTNLTVHVVDPTGLETLALDAARPSLERPSPDRTAINAENLRRQENLRYLPQRTGGRTLVNTNDPNALVAAVLGESSTYYTLGFRPHATKRDGQLHRIDVRVRRENVDVLARKAFVDGDARPAVSIDASAKIPPALRDALGGTWPAADLPIAVTMAPFADPAGGRPLTIVTIAAERTTNLASSAPVDVLVQAFDRDGRSVNYHHQALDIGAALAASGSGRFEIHARLPLEPGRYELRAGIRDGASDRIGTVHTHVDVPDFARDPLAISGVLVEAFPAGLMAPPGLLADVAEMVPTTRRAFAPSDTVAVLARIYQSSPSRAVTLVTRVTDASGKRVRDESKTIAAEAFTGTRERSFEVRQPLPVDTLTPGEYLLVLQATRGDRVEQRAIRFTIR